MLDVVVGEQGRRRVRPLVVLKAAVRIIPQPPLEQRERNSRAARELRGSDDHETHNLLFCFLGLAVTRKPKQASFFLVKKNVGGTHGTYGPDGATQLCGVLRHGGNESKSGMNKRQSNTSTSSSIHTVVYYRSTLYLQVPGTVVYSYRTALVRYWNLVPVRYKYSYR